MITSYIKTSKPEYIDESQWHLLDELIEKKELNIFYIMLKIELSRDGVEPLAFEDTLEELIRNLLLKSSLALLNDEDYHFGFMDYEGDVYMNVEGDQVQLEGDFISSTSFPQKDLIALFLEGADKMLKLMRDLHKNHPDFEFDAHAPFATMLREAQDKFDQKFS